jgi:putative nucleotidyltransferase with HDIG domain
VSVEISFEEQEVLAETFVRTTSRMSSRERLGNAVVSGAFVVAAFGLWRTHPVHAFALPIAVLFVLALAVTSAVRIDTPLGYTVPTQLVFVPMLFAVPAPLIPLAVVLALALSHLRDLRRRDARARVLFGVVCNSWFAVGPAAVLTVAGTDASHAGALVLVAALAAQFAVDFLASAVRFGIGRGASLALQLGDAWIYGVDVALSLVGFVAAGAIHGRVLATLALLPLVGLLATFARERHRRMRGLIELNNAYRGTALVFGDMVEADDGYTGEHCRGVVALALGVADKLGLNAEQRRNIEFAALLHDVGKIAIPKTIINKPGKLDPHEWTLIKTHTLEGQRMLDRVGGFMREVGLIVRSHHERWDGGGYPDGLAEDAIPLEARIIACCDTWNAMRTDRSYRKALPHDIAVAELGASSGSQLDPRVVETLIDLVTPTHDASAAGDDDRDRSTSAIASSARAAIARSAATTA